MVLRNKEAQEVFVRLPLWTDKKAVRCQMAPGEVSPVWFGQYLHFPGLQSGDQLTIDFPMVETTEKWTLDDQVHTCRFRGNTLIGMSPPFRQDSPLYQHRAKQYGTSQAPMKKVTRVVIPQTLQW